MSTAESELAELTEAMTAGESVAVLMEELYEEVRKVAWCDNQAAITILVGEGGSWRTRHLRMRSLFAKQAVLRGEWQIAHQPGETMIADIGTKSLTSTRLDLLKGLLGMERVPSEEAKKLSKQEAEETREAQEGQMREGSELKMKKATAVQLLILAAQMSLSKASETEEGEGLKKEEEGEEALEMMVFFYTVIVVVTTLLFQRMWKVGVRWMEEGSRKPSVSKARSLPADSEQEKDEEGEKEGKRGGLKEQSNEDEEREEKPSSSTQPMNVVTTTTSTTTAPTGGGIPIGGQVGSQNSQPSGSIGFNVLVTK